MAKSFVSAVLLASLLWMGLGATAVMGFDGKVGPASGGALSATQLGSGPEFSGQARMSAVDPDKRLSAGDQVTVQIVEDRDSGFARVVTATAELDVPPLGRVRVSGKTAADAAGPIKQLLEKKIMETGDAKSDPVLQTGDRITVPARSSIF